MKSFGLIPLAEKISKQSNMDSVVWLLDITRMKIYNELEQAEQDKLKIENLRRKDAPGSGMELSSVTLEKPD